MPFNGKGKDASKIIPTQRIQVYLMDDDKPISWWKGLLKDFDSTNASFRWCQLKADRAIDKVEDDYKAGMISMKLSVRKKGFGELDFKSEEAWNKLEPRRMSTANIRCFLF